MGAPFKKVNLSHVAQCVFIRSPSSRLIPTHLPTEGPEISTIMEIAQGLAENAQWKQNISTRKDLTDPELRGRGTFLSEGENINGAHTNLRDHPFYKNCPRCKNVKVATQEAGKTTDPSSFQTPSVRQVIWIWKWTLTLLSDPILGLCHFLCSPHTLLCSSVSLSEAAVMVSKRQHIFLFSVSIRLICIDRPGLKSPSNFFFSSFCKISRSFEFGGFPSHCFHQKKLFWRSS